MATKVILLFVYNMNCVACYYITLYIFLGIDGGPYLTAFRTCCWLCAQGSFLEVQGETTCAGEQTGISFMQGTHFTLYCSLAPLILGFYVPRFKKFEVCTS